MHETDEATLRRLAQKEAIRECVHRFARGMDRHDAALLRSTFHDHALDNHGDVVLPPDRFVEWANAWHENVSAHHFHSITSHFSDVSGDEAHAVTYVLFTLVRKDGTTIHTGGGRYIDRLEHYAGEWRIVVRRLVIDWRLNAHASANPQLEKHLRGTWDDEDPSYAHLTRRQE
jgi:hypothetical protein